MTFAQKGVFKITPPSQVLNKIFRFLYISLTIEPPKSVILRGLNKGQKEEI